MPQIPSESVDPRCAYHSAGEGRSRVRGSRHSPGSLCCQFCTFQTLPLCSFRAVWSRSAGRGGLGNTATESGLRRETPAQTRMRAPGYAAVPNAAMVARAAVLDWLGNRGLQRGGYRAILDRAMGNPHRARSHCCGGHTPSCPLQQTEAAVSAARACILDPDPGSPSQHGSCDCLPRLRGLGAISQRLLWSVW
jgi:hypothetical protein